jgi:AAA15 family ATPase/GTPase
MTLGVTMYLKEFRVQNFKSFKDVHFSLNSDVNIFTGVNNSGKTTILEAIALWQECFSKLVRKAGKAVAGKYRQNDFILGTKNQNLFSHQRFRSIRSTKLEDIFHNLQFKDETIILEGTLANEQESIKIAFGIKRSSGGQNYDVSHSNYNEFDHTKFNNFFSSFPLPIDLIYATPAAKLETYEEEQTFKKIKFLTQSRASIAVMRNRIKNLSTNSEQFQKYQNDLSLILNNRSGEISLQFAEPEGDELNLTLLISTDRNDTKKEISLLGGGTIQIMEILLTLYEENKDLNLVLLDEPDSYIHRDIQKRLLDRIQLATSNSQFFITTHNEALIRSSKPKFLFHLERKNIAEYKNIYQGTLPFYEKKGLQPTAYQNIFASLSDSNSLDFINALECDKLIFVEGSDDAKHFQILLMNKIHQKKIMFWATGGINNLIQEMENYYKVFSSIRNRESLWDKVIIIFDKDWLIPEQKEKLERRLQNKYNRPIKIWSSYTFESTLLTDIPLFQNLLQKYIFRKTNSPDFSNFENHWSLAFRQLEDKIKEKPEQKNAKNKAQLEEATHRISSLRDNLEKMDIEKIFEYDISLTTNLLKYYSNEFSVSELANKSDIDIFINEITKHYSFSFSIERDFSDLLHTANDNNIWFSEWDFLRGI